MTVASISSVAAASVSAIEGVAVAGIASLNGQAWPSGWWQAGGATGALVAYQPKGAASLAASYVNLANPGTNDAAPGTAPTFNATTGWTFNGSTQYLDSGIIVPDLTYSVLVRIDNGGTITEGRIFGSADGGGNYFSIYSNFGGSCYFGNGNQNGFAPGQASGVIGFAGLTAYVGGSSVGSITAGGAQSGFSVYIGSNNLSAVAGAFWSGDIYAFAIYDNTLSAGQVSAVSTAMAAL